MVFSSITFIYLLLDLSQYQVKTYQNWFLGSYGKKTGRLFAWEGAEDIDLLTPLFSTEFVEEIPSKDTIRQGSFIETIFHMERMKKEKTITTVIHMLYTAAETTDCR